MRRLHGFSLMEMMIVLTIVAVIAAASAPMVNKKMVRAASEKSPWVFVNGESIGYNIDNDGGIQDRKTATIGSNGRSPQGNPRLYIDINSDTTPHILFGRSRNMLMRFVAGGDKGNVWLSNNALTNTADHSVGIGWNSNANSNRSVAVGMDTEAQSTSTVALGNLAKARAISAIAVGDGAQAGQNGGTDANKYAAIAIGSEAEATRTRSIALGRRAKATNTGAIAIGSSGNDSITNDARAQGLSAIAIGQSALAQNDNSIALGGSAEATGNTSIAINGNAPSNNSISIGWTANAASNNSLAFGYNARTGAGNVSGNQNGGKQIALGYSANATYYESIALGAGCAASNYRSLAIGSESQALATSSIALGREALTTSSANDAIAIGNKAQATAANSVAIGRGAIANQKNEIKIGTDDNTVVIPGNLIVEGSVLMGAKNGSETWVREADGRWFYKFRQCRDKVDRQGNRGSITAFDMSGQNQITFKGYSYSHGYTSDRRLKNVGKEFTSGLDKLRKLEIFNYTFKDDKDKTPRVGVMAQDLQKIFPDAVVKGEDGFLRIRMEDMFYAVINAVKELDSRTSAQEKKIKELEKRIEELEKRK